MADNGNDLMRDLSMELAANRTGECLSDEDIAELIDGRMDKQRKKDMISHISSCETCFEIYRTAGLMGKRSLRTRSRRFPVWSVAATLFIAVFSYLVFFRSNVPEIKRERSGPLMTAERTVKKNEAVMKRIEKKDQPRGKKGGTAVKQTEKDLPPARTEPPRKEGKTTETVSAGPPAAPVQPAAAPVQAAAQQSELSSVQEERPDEDREEQVKEKGGLVKRIAMADETAAGRKPDPRCFRRSGDKYIRNPRFLTGLSLSETVPEAIVTAHPGDSPGFGKLPADESFIFEILTDGSGGVRWACLQEGNAENSFIVVNSLMAWSFRLTEPRPVRFRIVLKLDREGKLEVIEKK